jgi:hypothetical protein
MENEKACLVIDAFQNLSRRNQQPRTGRNGLYYTGLRECFQALWDLLGKRLTKDFVFSKLAIKIILAKIERRLNLFAFQPVFF